MSSDQTIDYEGLAQDAMRGLVRTILKRVHKHGLPGDHHFYIAFYTQAPGVSVSNRLKEKYPEEMTIVMQHRFWGLQVYEDRFELKLTFDSIPERLVVPYNAIKVFFDPSVPYGLQFEENDAKGDDVNANEDLDQRGSGLGDLSLVDSTTRHYPSGTTQAPAAVSESPIEPTPVKKRPRRKPKTTNETAALGTDQAVPKHERTKNDVVNDNDSGAPEEETAATADRKKPVPTPTAVPQILSDRESDNIEDETAGDTAVESDTSAKVVSLDAFRKK